jgi:hypothetical protein
MHLANTLKIISVIIIITLIVHNVRLHLDNINWFSFLFFVCLFDL